MEIVVFVALLVARPSPVQRSCRESRVEQTVRPLRERTMGNVARGSRTVRSRVSSVPPRHDARAEGQSPRAACSGRRSVKSPAVPDRCSSGTWQ